jgi:hypothetical protein
VRAKRGNAAAEKEGVMVERHGLAQLVDRIPTRSDDEVASLVVEGRALSKSDTSLHVAVRTGLIAVPLDSIARVMSVPGTKDIVKVVVRNPEGIRPLLRVGRGVAAQVGGGPSIRRGDVIGTVFGPGVSTCTYYNTETETGEEGYDASDDDDPVCGDDDEPS